eukprot:CAMPEP_0179842164 /NCGR_PEP_ID=MMETSP0982-20121206/2972_1 /TAXON_ID=483367 /ORGANISM="non described non described, Strain CCMP 2436" /LENGTH=75 /DNA_ID=CAMNT_0021726401 /DNA_START=1244 /DNA_END=1468 /DNA_ORIENTATION=-
MTPATHTAQSVAAARSALYCRTHQPKSVDGDALAFTAALPGFAVPTGCTNSTTTMSATTGAAILVSIAGEIPCAG